MVSSAVLIKRGMPKEASDGPYRSIGTGVLRWLATEEEMAGKESEEECRATATI